MALEYAIHAEADRLAKFHPTCAKEVRAAFIAGVNFNRATQGYKAKRACPNCGHTFARGKPRKLNPEIAQKLYYEGKSMDEIGRTFGVTRQAVSHALRLLSRKESSRG